MVVTLALLAGLGSGLVLGIAVGIWFLKETSGVMVTAVEKSTYAVAYPHPDVQPIQPLDPSTLHAFDSQDVDDERVPDWMEDDYPMPGVPQ